MAKEVEGTGTNAKAICGGQVLVLPGQVRRVPKFVEEHPDLDRKSPDYVVRVIPDDKKSEATAAPVRPPAKKEVSYKDEPAPKNREEFAKAGTTTMAADAISMIPPDKRAPNEKPSESNPAYNAGSGVSMVPPPAEPAPEEEPAEVLKKATKNKSKKKGKK